MNNLPSPRQLQYLVSVAETLHFGQAADHCGISQPALSAQLSKLEKDLGVHLVERTTRKVLLTPAGEEAARHARLVLVQLEQLTEAVRQGTRPLVGPFTLGIIPTIAPYLLPALLPKVRKQFPELKLLLREEQTSRLLDGLRSGKVDAAVLALPVSTGEFESSVLGEEGFALVVPKGHRLGGQRIVDQEALRGEEVLLLEDGHCFRDNALALCSKVGAHEASSIRANSISTLVHMVANGLGVTLLPESAVPTELRGMEDAEAIAFADPGPRRTMGLVWRKSSGRKADIAELLPLLRQHIARTDS